MGTSRYKGFRILARPWQLHESKRWTADLEIRRNGSAQPIGHSGHYPTEQEASAQGEGLCRRIIDGGIEGRSVTHLRGATGWSAFSRRWGGEATRQLLGAGVLVLALGLFVLLGGLDFNSHADIVTAGDEIRILTEAQLPIPRWAGWAGAVAGVALIVAGVRKRA